MNVNVMVASASSENTLGAICWGFLKASSVEYASAHNSGLFMHRAWKVSHVFNLNRINPLNQ